MRRSFTGLAIVSLLGVVVFFGTVVGQAQEAATEAGRSVGWRETAPGPRLIQFSGVLQDSAGKPLTGVQGVTFAFYKEQQDGSPLWLETQNVTADEQGRFAVLLGATKSDGVPLDLFTSGESRWLGVQAIQSRDRDGAVLMEQPRVLLVSVPYALQAADAETLGGKPASAYRLADPNPDPSRDSNGAANSSSPDSSGGQRKSFLNTAAVTTGTAGRIARFAANGTDLEDSILFDDGSGRVGLGTTVPAAKLTVLGDAYLFANGGNSAFEMRSAGVPARRGLVVPPDPNGQIKFYVHEWQTNSGFEVRSALDDRLLFRITGLGVGEFNNLRVQNQDNNPRYVLESNDPNTSRRNMDLLGTGSSAVWRFYKETKGTDTTQNYLGITSDGNVGVGTIAPTARLEVAGGNVKISGTPGTHGLIFPDATTQTTAMRTAALTRGITFIAGCEWCGPLADNYDQPKIYYNLVGPMTINSVTCFSDTGAPVIQIAKNGVNILSSNLTCSATGASTTSFSNNALNAYDFLDFVMVTAGGAAHRVTVTIQATIN